jgi:hypothetical protein
VLVVVDDDIISVLERIDEGKYIIVLTLDPWIVGTMTKYECIPDFSWTGCSWISDDSFFELLHEYILHLAEFGRGNFMIDIDEWDIFAKPRYHDTILIGRHIECCIRWRCGYSGTEVCCIIGV